MKSLVWGAIADISINRFLFQVNYSQETHAEQVKSHAHVYCSYLTNKTPGLMAQTT